MSDDFDWHAFTRDWPGLLEAMNIAVAIERAGYGNMSVTHSPDDEYTSSFDVKATKTE